MSVSALVMMVFGLAITWGGAIACFCIAFGSDERESRSKDN